MVRKYPKEKTPELYQAKRALISYLRSNNLDPGDNSLLRDPVHGPILTDLVNKLNKERDKVMANYPALDRSNNLKLLKMAKENKKAKKAKKIQEVETTAKETKKEKKSVGRTSTKYDYPQVKDESTGKMRDMNSTEKKKYRMEQRKAANGGTTNKAKKDEAPSKVEKVEKKAKKEKEAPKVTSEKKDKKKKKAKKDED